MVRIGRPARSIAPCSCIRQLESIDTTVDAPVRAQVKIRNKHAAAPATLHPAGDPGSVEVVFDEPQRAVTPGQGAVFCDGDLVLGGGWIG